MSFFLWAAAPDAELTKLAMQGRLTAPGMLEKQVARMLADPRAESLSTRFAAQWLRLSDVAATPVKPEEIAPILRGALAYDRGEGRFDRFVVDFRTSGKIRDFLALGDLERLASAGVSTPDLVIRIKRTPLLLETPKESDLDGFAASVSPDGKIGLRF